MTTRECCETGGHRWETIAPDPIESTVKCWRCDLVAYERAKGLGLERKFKEAGK